MCAFVRVCLHRDCISVHNVCAYLHVHMYSVLTIPVAVDALLPADCEAVQTQTSCSAAT